MKEDEEPTLHHPDLHLAQQLWGKLEVKQKTRGNVGAEGLRPRETREELLGAAVHFSVPDFQTFRDF